MQTSFSTIEVQHINISFIALYLDFSKAKSRLVHAILFSSECLAGRFYCCLTQRHGDAMLMAPVPSGVKG